MGSKQLSADLNYAWPTARIAVIGADGAAQLLMKRFPDPTTPEAQQIKKDFIDGYNLNMAIPWIAAERGYIDGVIEPHETRLLLRKSLHISAGQADSLAYAAQARPDADLDLRGEIRRVELGRALRELTLGRSDEDPDPGRAGAKGVPHRGVRHSRAVAVETGYRDARPRDVARCIGCPGNLDQADVVVGARAGPARRGAPRR